jgi:hypothetical protein
VEKTCSLLIGVGPKGTTTTHQTTKLEAMLRDGLASTSAQSALPATLADIATISLAGSPADRGKRQSTDYTRGTRASAATLQAKGIANYASLRSAVRAPPSGREGSARQSRIR